MCLNIISFVEDTPKSIVPVWYVYGSNLSEGSGYEYKGKFTTEKVLCVDLGMDFI